MLPGPDVGSSSSLKLVASFGTGLNFLTCERPQVCRCMCVCVRESETDNECVSTAMERQDSFTAWRGFSSKVKEVTVQEN